MTDPAMRERLEASDLGTAAHLDSPLAEHTYSHEDVMAFATSEVARERNRIKAAYGTPALDALIDEHGGEEAFAPLHEVEIRVAYEDDIRAALAIAEQEKQAMQKSADTWRDKWATMNGYYHDRDKEAREAKGEVQALRQELLALGTPYPVHSMLGKLADAADILLREKDYDGHGHEEIGCARDAARAYLAIAALSPTAPEPDACVECGDSPATYRSLITGKCFCDNHWPPSDKHLPAAPEPSKPDPDEKRGLYRKYTVERVNDPTRKHASCEYFVLDWAHDPFTIPAMDAYAVACAEKYPDLAKSVRYLIESYRAPEPSKPEDIQCDTCGGPLVAGGRCLHCASGAIL